MLAALAVVATAAAPGPLLPSLILIAVPMAALSMLLVRRALLEVADAPRDAARPGFALEPAFVPAGARIRPLIRRLDGTPSTLATPCGAGPHARRRVRRRPAGAPRAMATGRIAGPHLIFRKAP
jgi:hypothetical protein